jgi:hypothetical protein
MTTTAVEHLLSRDRQRALPDVVYHYTSPAGLLGMVSSGSIWASDVRYLNDAQEFQYALDLVAPQLAAIASAPSTGDAPAVAELQRALSIAPRVRMYAASFSGQPDLLSQWRAYCPDSGGFAIGFTPDVLTKASDCMLTACVYEREEQERLAGDLLRFMLNKHRSTPVAEHEPERLKDVVALGAEFLGGITYLASIFKHDGFAEEQEWRLIHRGSPGSDLRLHFREGRSGVVPYVSLSLKPDGKNLRVDQVVIGPNPHVELARDAVQSLLELYGAVHDGVAVSRIPYRPW